jgi:hypothetical protein
VCLLWRAGGCSKPALAAALEASGRSVMEERLIPMLLDDLRRRTQGR